MWPIFIFAASWRTGSTLLQRMLTATEGVLIWGEAGGLHLLARLYEHNNHYLAEKTRDQPDPDRELHLQWIPVMTPPRDRLVKAMRAFFFQMYAIPARELDRPRWGIKEVRRDAVPVARMLQKVFPRARFVFLARDPYDTLASVKGTSFFRQFKDAAAFLEIWAGNVADFLDEKKTSDLAHRVVRYEDLVAEGREEHPRLTELFEFLRLPLQDAVFEALGKRIDGGSSPAGLTPAEVRATTEVAGDLLERLGYPMRG
jgi:hypothetical protein